MGQKQSLSQQAKYIIQEDDKNLRRQRALFFPLGENRRLKKIDYLLVSSDMYTRGESNQVFKDKDIFEKRKQLTTLSTYNLELMEEAIKEYDFNLGNDKERKLIKLELKMTKPKFENYLDELFSNPNTNGFMIYFTGQLTEHKQQLVLSNQSGEILLYDFYSIIRRWRQVPNYQNKSLLIVLDAENCGSYLGLKKNAPFNANENIFDLQNYDENTPFVLRKDPTFSILASQSNRKRDTDFYMGESPNNNFQKDFKNNNRLDASSKGPSTFDDASNHNISADQNAQLTKLQKSSNFTAVFSEYLKSGPFENIKNIVKAKNINPQNENEPYFFGHEMKAYHDFGIFFWAKYQKMMNQLELNCYVSLGLTILKESQANSNNSKVGQFCTLNNPQQSGSNSDEKNFMQAQNPAESIIVNNLQNSSSKQNMVSTLTDIEQQDTLNKKLLQLSAQGEYFGFVGKNMRDQKFGNPQFSKPATLAKSSNHLKSYDNLDVQYTSNHVSSLTHMDDLLHSSFQSNNAFKSTILRGQQNMDDGTVVRKYYGMQEYKKENETKAFSELYEGMWTDDKFHNYGTYYYQNGDRYEGEYKSGRKNGFGVYYFANGDIYAGQFNENIIEGYGKLLYSNGSIYIGNFKSNKRSGFGVMKQQTENSTMIYSGEWLNNEQNGKAKILISHIPQVEMEATFNINKIQGDAIYTVNTAINKDGLKTEPDPSHDKITFIAQWRDNKRISDIHIEDQEQSTKKKDVEAQYLSIIKQLEDAYASYIPPTIQI